MATPQDSTENLATAEERQEEERQADILANHLPEGYTAGFDGSLGDGQNQSRTAQNGDSLEPESSLKLQGGDIHRDLYKIDAKSRFLQRAATFAAPRPHTSPVTDLPYAEQRAPGGFRRDYVARKHRRFDSANLPVTRNFVEFLNLYGSFAGEDLEESDDESAIEDEEDTQPTETRPLLGRRKTSRLERKKGDAGITKSFFTLLKAFIGTGIMFLPKAFDNGGILFSSITLVMVSLITTIAFHLLLQCRQKYGGGYGDLGEAVGGPRLRGLILASVAISQIGFVCAGVVFFAENLYSFLEAVTHGKNQISSRVLILLQAVVLIPLSFIRNISKLGLAALLADVCIMVGLTYIYWYDISTLVQDGIHPTVQLFNPNYYTLTVGAAIFTFEGIGLILPIQSSMKRPDLFEPLLWVIMGIITVIFTSVGLLCYATFGEKTQIEIISNYPQSSKLVNAVQFLYSVAVLVGTPVQLFPALRIIEGKIFGRNSGKRDAITKWKKNGFRTALVMVCIGISIAGAGHLDRFVALIGSFACVPLVYIYPPLLHYRGIADTRWAKIGDITLMVGGVLAMVYTTIITIRTSFL